MKTIQLTFCLLTVFTSFAQQKHDHSNINWSGIEDEFTYAAPTHVKINDDTLDAYSVKILTKTSKKNAWVYVKYNSDTTYLALLYTFDSKAVEKFPFDWKLLEPIKSNTGKVSIRKYGGFLFIGREKIIQHTEIVPNYPNEEGQYEVKMVYVALIDSNTPITQKGIDELMKGSKKSQFAHDGTVHFPKLGGGG